MNRRGRHSRYRDDSELEEYARRLRRAVGFEFLPFFCVQEFVERLKIVFPGLSIVPVPDDQMGQDDAVTVSGTKTIKIKDSVWRAARDGADRPRMIVFHEIAHIALGHAGFRYRASQSDVRSKLVPAISIDESEAKRFASMLAAPEYLISDFTSAADLARNFGVSLESARIRMEKASVMARRRHGELRELPRSVREFLEEKQQAGHPVKSLNASRTAPSHSPAQLRTTYEPTPCQECGNFTVLRRGSDVTCDRCGCPNGCGC